MNDRRMTVARWSLEVTLVTLLFQLGGSLYEGLVVDTVWPARPALIQPAHGGLDRKAFWIPVHGVVQLSLPLALWAAWRAQEARRWIAGALLAYLAIRVWTFAYFIPVALAFEAGLLIDRAAADAWVGWTWWRAPLLVAATIAVAVARRPLTRDRVSQ